MTADIKPYVWQRSEPELPARSEPLPSASGPAPTASPVPSGGEVRDEALPAGINADSTHALLWRHATETAAVLRTWMRQQEPVEAEGVAGLAPSRAAATLVRGLGKQVAARIVQHLRNDGELAWLGRALIDEPPMTHADTMAVIDLARRFVVNGDYIEDGGADYAAEVLARAVGSNRARTILQQGDTSPFDFLRDAPAELVAPYISHEHPQTIALILSQLEVRQGAGILSQLPERMQTDVSRRLGTLENVPPEVLWRLGNALQTSLDDVIVPDEAIGGPKVLAHVLNHTGSSVERNVLNYLDAEVPELGEATRSQMFTFEDIANMGDRDVQVFVEALEPKDLATALKAATENTKDRILGQMPEEQRRAVTEEMEYLGPMRLSDVEQVQLRCVQLVRQLEEQGKVVIIRGDAGSFGTFV